MNGVQQQTTMDVNAAAYYPSWTQHNSFTINKPQTAVNSSLNAYASVYHTALNQNNQYVSHQISGFNTAPNARQQQYYYYYPNNQYQYDYTHTQQTNTYLPTNVVIPSSQIHCPQHIPSYPSNITYYEKNGTVFYCKKNEAISRKLTTILYKRSTHKTSKHQPHSIRICNKKELLITGYTEKYLNCSKWIIPNVIIDLFMKYYGIYYHNDNNKLVLFANNTIARRNRGFYLLDYVTQKLIYYKPAFLWEWDYQCQTVASDIKCNYNYLNIDKYDVCNALFICDTAAKSELKYECVLFTTSNAIQISLPRITNKRNTRHFRSVYSKERNQLIVVSQGKISIFSLTEWNWISLIECEYIRTDYIKGIALMDNTYKLFVAGTRKHGCFIYDLNNNTRQTLKWLKNGFGGNSAICCDDILNDMIYIYKKDKKRSIKMYDINTKQWVVSDIPNLKGFKEPIMWLPKDQNTLFVASCSKDGSAHITVKSSKRDLSEPKHINNNNINRHNIWKKWNDVIWLNISNKFTFWSGFSMLKL